MKTEDGLVIRTHCKAEILYECDRLIFLSLITLLNKQHNFLLSTVSQLFLMNMLYCTNYGVGCFLLRMSCKVSGCEGTNEAFKKFSLFLIMLVS